MAAGYLDRLCFSPFRNGSGRRNSPSFPSTRTQAMHPFLILGLAIVFVLVAILALRMHAFVALILAALLVALLTPTSRLKSYADLQVEQGKWTKREATRFLVDDTFGERVAKGFGSTCANIGILIAAASIIGTCLLASGAAERIVNSLLAWWGERRAGMAFVASGFLLGIPVFFDTVFYLLIPLGKAAAWRTGGNYLFFVLTIMAGATMAHSLVPPTPGPLIVVEQLRVDLGLMMIVGSLVGLVASGAGYFAAAWLNRQVPLEPPAADRPIMAEEGSSRRLPSLALSLAPILLPVVLIAGSTLCDFLLVSSKTAPDAASLPAIVLRMARVLHVLGDKNVALVLAAIMAVGVLIRTQSTSRRKISERIHQALIDAGMIILITAAGGAFGATIRQSGIAEEIAARAQHVPALWLLPLAFGVTALIRTAQGSATVAMITAAGVLQGIADPETLSFNVVYLAVAIGCGSKPISWMADSGFWVICKMSGMTESQGLRTISPLTLIMGLAGLAATMLGAWLVPLN